MQAAGAQSRSKPSRSRFRARRLARTNCRRLAPDCASMLSRNRLASAARASAGSAIASLKMSAALRFMRSILTATTSRQDRPGTRDRAVCQNPSDRTADAVRGAATKGGGWRRNRNIRTEELHGDQASEGLNRAAGKSLSGCMLPISVVLNPRGVLCRATTVSHHRRQRIRGVSNPPVLPRHPSRTLFGGCSRPACRWCCRCRNRMDQVGRRAR